MGLKTTAFRSSSSSPAYGTIFRTQSMAAVRFSLGKGVKRKRGKDDGSRLGATHTPHGFHCGTLLDLSLLKLHQSCVLAEHNLRRSVLIANALRRLQAEICPESGRNVPPHSPSEPAKQPTDGANRPVPVSGPGAGSTDLNNNLPAASQAETPFCLLSGNDSSLSSAISTILQDLDVVEDLSPPPGQLSLEDDHLLPLKPATPDPRGEPRPPDSIFAAFEITDSNDFLVDGSLDAIFEDIDTSMYDAQQSFSAGAWGLAKAQPSPTSQPVKASIGSPSAKAHNSRTDFTDLENLMELLVG